MTFLLKQLSQLLVITIMLATSNSFCQHGSLKGQNRLVDGNEQYRFYIKINTELCIDVENGKLKSYSSKRTHNKSLFKELKPFHFHQLLKLDKNEHTFIHEGRQGRNPKSGIDKTQFSGLVELEEATHMEKHQLLALANKLESFPSVEYCELVPIKPIAPPTSLTDVLPPAPSQSWEQDQYYLFGVDEANPNIIGIHADYAWDLGITGQGITIADIEWGFNYLHEEFSTQNILEVIETTDHGFDDHGTAVMGEMYAGVNDYGVSGACYGADEFRGYSEITNGRPAAILEAIGDLEAGDIFVYEMQTYGPTGAFVPADYSQSVWDVTKTATDAGIIVIAAAGNGNVDLDGASFGAYRGRGDNGSIIVGGASRIDRNKTSSSTYGSPVHVSGYGDGSVYTTGYGDLYSGSQHSTYTATFSGTSSATPIAASAAVLVQCYAKQELGRILSPTEMRVLLIETGTPQGTGGHIGPVPNVKAAIETLRTTPVVSFISPTTNQVLFMEPLEAIELSADVFVNTGNITGVTFEVGGQQLVASLQGDYYVTNWTPNSYGTYEIIASAQSDNNKTTQVAINIEIDLPPKDHDLQALSLSQLPSDICGNSADLNLTVFNKGIQAIQTYDVEVWIGTSLIKTVAVSSLLNAGETEAIALTDITFLEDGQQDVTVKITNPNGLQDENNLNNELSTNTSISFGDLHEFVVVERSANLNMSWEISQVGGTVISSSDVTKIASNGDQIQEFCLDYGCYDIEVIDAFISGDCAIPEWVPAQSYSGGDLVYFDGLVYKAKWWTQGHQPDLFEGSSGTDYWLNQGECAISVDTDTYLLRKKGEASYFDKQVQHFTGTATHQFCHENASTEYTLTYNGNGHLGGSTPTSVSLNAGSTVEISGPGDLFLNGYVFAGWNTKADGTGTLYAPIESIVLNNNLDLYAMWELPTSLSEVNKNLIWLYPNPASTMCFVHGAKENSELKIYDSSNRMIKKLSYEHSGINISNLESGLYFIEVNKSIMKMIIIK